MPILRRTFLGSTAAALTMVGATASAQQGKVFRIGYPSLRAGPAAQDDAFLKGMRRGQSRHRGSLGRQRSRPVPIAGRGAGPPQGRPHRHLHGDGDPRGDARNRQDPDRDGGGGRSGAHGVGRQPGAPRRQRHGPVAHLDGPCAETPAVGAGPDPRRSPGRRSRLPHPRPSARARPAHSRSIGRGDGERRPAAGYRRDSRNLVEGRRA